MRSRPLPGHARRSVAILAPLWVVAAALALAACSKPAAAPEPVRAVRTLTIRAGQTGGAIDYAAEVRARVESRLAFRVGGKMLSRPAGLGDSVKAGQVLASLDPQDLRLGQDAVLWSPPDFHRCDLDFRSMKRGVAIMH